MHFTLLFLTKINHKKCFSCLFNAFRERMIVTCLCLIDILVEFDGTGVPPAVLAKVFSPSRIGEVFRVKPEKWSFQSKQIHYFSLAF